MSFLARPTTASDDTVPSRVAPPTPLLSPQWMSKGPHRPGTTIPMRLPLALESPVSARHVTVTFHSDCENVTFNPERQYYKEIAPKSTTFLTTEMIVPSNVVGQVLAWAEVSAQGIPMQKTLPATIDIEPVPKIEIEAFASHFVLRNIGSADTSILLQVDHPEHLNEPPVPINVTEDGIQLLVPAQSRPIHWSFRHSIGSIRLFTDDGNRIFIDTYNENARRGELTISGKLLTHIEGVRPNDLIQAEIRVGTTGEIPIYEGFMTMILPSYLHLDEPPLISIDHLGVIPEDVQIEMQGEKQIVRLRVGRILPKKEAVISCGIRIAHLPMDGRDHLEMLLEMRAGADYEPRASTLNVPLLMAPIYADTTTFLNEEQIEQHEDGTKSIPIEITQPPGTNVRFARIRIFGRGCRIERVLKQTDIGSARHLIALNLQSTTVSEEPATIATIGPLQGGRREYFSLIVRSISPEAYVHVDLIADDRVTAIGSVELERSKKPTLQHSSATFENEALRVNHPLTGTISLRNSGSAPLQDVRICIQGEEALKIAVANERIPIGKWIQISGAIAPGGAISVPVTLELQSAPSEESTEVVVMADARDVGTRVIGRQRIKTPAQPTITLSRISTRVTPTGLVLVAVDIANDGDGICPSILLNVPAEQHVIPRTCYIDETPVLEHTGKSALHEGVRLRDLPPAGWRTICWVLAPQSEETPVTLQAVWEGADGTEMATTSTVVYTPMAPSFAIALPPARRLSLDQHAPSFAPLPDWFEPQGTQSAVPQPPAPKTEVSATVSDLPRPALAGDDRGNATQNGTRALPGAPSTEAVQPPTPPTLPTSIFDQMAEIITKKAAPSEPVPPPVTQNASENAPSVLDRELSADEIERLSSELDEAENHDMPLSSATDLEAFVDDFTDESLPEESTDDETDNQERQTKRDVLEIIEKDAEKEQLPADNIFNQLLNNKNAFAQEKNEEEEEEFFAHQAKNNAVVEVAISWAELFETSLAPAQIGHILMLRLLTCHDDAGYDQLTAIIDEEVTSTTSPDAERIAMRISDEYDRVYLSTLEENGSPYDQWCVSHLPDGQQEPIAMYCTELAALIDRRGTLSYDAWIHQADEPSPPALDRALSKIAALQREA